MPMNEGLRKIPPARTLANETVKGIADRNKNDDAWKYADKQLGQLREEATLTEQPPVTRAFAMLDEVATELMVYNKLTTNEQPASTELDQLKSKIDVAEELAEDLARSKERTDRENATRLNIKIKAVRMDLNSRLVKLHNTSQIAHE